MQECHIAASELVVPSGNAPKLLDASEESLDEIAILVQMGIVRPEFLAVGARRDNRLRRAGSNGLDQSIGIVALVAYDCLGGDTGNQVGGMVDIGDLSSAQNQPQWIAQRIHRGVHLGAQSAARAPDRLSAFFFWAPAACWWARTMVESISSCSRSASPWKTSAWCSSDSDSMATIGPVSTRMGPFKSHQIHRNVQDWC